MILSGELILKCVFFWFFFLHDFFHSSFTAGTTGCVSHTYITLSFSVGVGDDRRSENCNDQYN